jgi:hypothetical protein
MNPRLTKPKDSSVVISFRLSRPHARELKRKAIAHNTTLNLYSREVLLDAIAQSDIREELTAIHSDVQRLSTQLSALESRNTSCWQILLEHLTDLSPDEITDFLTD